MSVTVVVCYDIGVGRGIVTQGPRFGIVARYGRSKFVLQNVDFWAPYEIARNDDEICVEAKRAVIVHVSNSLQQVRASSMHEVQRSC